MEYKVLLQFLILFLGFSYVLSSRTLPDPSAYLKSRNKEPSIQEFVGQGSMEGRINGDGSKLEEAIIRGRIDIESNDYPGTGANPRHDPNTPPPRH